MKGNNKNTASRFVFENIPGTEIVTEEDDCGFLIIKSPESLKNPVICYAAMQSYCIEAGEDFLEYNETIAAGWPFVTWMYGRKYINDEITDQFAERNLESKKLAFWNLDSNIMTMYDVLHDEILFPMSYGEYSAADCKKYALAAEYLSGMEEFRKKLYEGLLGENAFTGGFYKDENGIPISCKIDMDNLKSEYKSIESLVAAVKDCNGVYELTFLDAYTFATNITIEEADEMIPEDE